jgi:hypothetical protein
MSWTLEDFKSTSLEVGQWCWGTLEGAFNEKQTISQVIVDAVIGMIPLLGDVTAVRDLLAVGIGMSAEPKKREEVMQWVLLAILLFALIPIVGGVVKGVGRLALRITGDVAKDTELLAEVIQFLNRMGHGDAQKWLKALDIGKYQSELLSKCKDFCSTVQLAIRKSLDARVGKLLPEVWRAKLEQIRAGFYALQDLADKMIPQAIKELDAKLKTLQNMVYRGEIHEIATGGMPKVKREAEAYLEERKLARQIKRGQFESAECEVGGTIGNEIRAKYQPEIGQGWPDILRKKSTEHPAFPGEPVYQSVASFHGKIEALDAKRLAGKTLYRTFGKASRHADETFAGGMFWGFGNVPKGAEEWRIRSAVLDEWNGNGFIAILHFPSDLASRMPEAKGWGGQIAEQFGKDIPAQYLEGGGQQLFIDLKELAQEITTVGDKLKAGEAVQPLEKNGIRVEFRSTNWSNVEDVYGYSKFEDDIRGAARTRRLATDEIQSKITNSKATAAARADNANGQHAN